MKQKITIKVPTNCQKCCKKAMKIAVGLPGVESASFKGEDKGQIEITGESVDAVKLTSKLRKKMGYADLLSVSEVKKEEKPKAPKAVEVVAQSQPYMVYAYGPPSYVYGYPEPTTYYQNPSCCIM